MNAKKYKEQYANERGCDSWEDLKRLYKEDLAHYENAMMIEFAEAYADQKVTELIRRAEQMQKGWAVTVEDLRIEAKAMFDNKTQKHEV